MGYTMRDLSVEIAERIDEMAADVGIGKEGLIASIMANHSDIEGDDADFALVCSHETVRSQVEAHFRKIKRNESEPDGQLTLEGFDHLQQRYIVESEDGERIALNVDRMSPSQLREKCAQLRAMGTALFAHADEIERYARMTNREWDEAA